MKKLIFTVMMLAFLVSCSNGDHSRQEIKINSQGETVAMEPSNTSLPTNTPEPAPTDTPEPTATHTLIPTQTPTLDPKEGLAGKWLCENCPHKRFFEILDTVNGFQVYWMRDSGEIIEWVGPESCKNIHIPYFDCQVDVTEAGIMTLYWRELIYGVENECYQIREMDFGIKKGELTITRFVSTSPCSFGGPYILDHLLEYSPWEAYLQITE